jgi:hypothetical protein
VRKAGLGLYQIDQSLPSSFTATWLRVATPDSVMAVRLLTTLGWIAIAPNFFWSDPILWPACGAGTTGMNIVPYQDKRRNMCKRCIMNTIVSRVSVRRW